MIKLSLVRSRSKMNYSFLEAVSNMVCTVFREQSNIRRLKINSIYFPCMFGKSYMKEDQIHQLNFIIDFRLIHIKL